MALEVKTKLPAKDRYHDVVVRALRKDGWAILEEQVALTMPSRRVWIDIRAAKNDGRVAILVEVKGFERRASPVAYLTETIGQCLLYQTMLEHPRYRTRYIWRYLPPPWRVYLERW